MDSATEKLELGLQRLAKAGSDADMLGLALQSIHGALEDHFRARLAADSQVPESQRAAMLDPKQVQWKDLLDAMQLYGGLSATDREQIWRANIQRTKVAHGGHYAGTRADLERYASLAQQLCGYVASTAGAAPARPATKAAESRRVERQPPAARAGTPADAPRPSKPADIPRAVRTGTLPRAPRAAWPGGLLALGLLIALALFVLLRNIAQPRAATADLPTREAIIAQEPSSAPAPTGPPAPTALPRSATVSATDGINLREDHSESAKVLQALPVGTRVSVIGGPFKDARHTWWKIAAGDQQGWCAGEFLAFDANR